MNCSYRSICNDDTGTFVAVSEHVASAGKKSATGPRTATGNPGFALKGLAVSLLLAFGANVHALPVGGVVSAGGASIGTTAGSTIINQSSQNAAINWQSFGIGLGESVRFIQPNSNSVALNRVLGPDPSNILGSLSANGKVFLVNPNGVIFGKGAQVNVGGLVASTLDITDSDFMAGLYRFTGNSSASILNQGLINADGGYVALLGAKVGNDGIIQARLGTVALAAGNAITLDVAGDGLLNVTVNEGAVSALVQNAGLIQADGGNVLLTARAAGTLLQSAVNNTGVIQAQTIENRNGTIRLMGDMQIGTVNVGGKLDASAPNGGDGGFIETSAANVNIAHDAKITTMAAKGVTGTWLIDPTDFTIGSAPGDNIAGTTLSALLVTNSVVIDTATGINATNAGATPPVTGFATSTAGAGNGDIFVNDAVTWTPTPSPTTLTLRAARDVNVNAAITTTGGNFVVCCGRDIKVNAAVTTTNGDVSLTAGRDVIVSAAMTTTNGNVLLRAGPDATGVGGLLGGTVVFSPLILYTVTAGTPKTVTVDYTPTSYATPNSYLGNFTGTGAALLTQHMLVFAKGNDKVYDGNNTATLSFAGNPSLGGAVTLVPGTATFDDKNVAANIGITYSGYSLGGANADKFALWTACSAVAGTGTTSAAITPRPMTLKANDNTKVYGQTFTPLSTAFTLPVPPIAGETVTSVTETSPGQVATAAVAGSPYVITPGNAAGTFTPSNYTISYVDGLLTVVPAGLVVTVNGGSILTGFTSVGLMNGDTIGSITGTRVTPAVGPGGTITPSNYAIVYVPGELTETPASNDEIPVELPVEVPVIPDRVTPWVPIVVQTRTPPQLLALLPPAVLAEPPLVLAEPPPVLLTQEPVVVPVPPPSQKYVAPIYIRKQDRN